MENLAAKYAGHDVEFFHFYAREPHAGEKEFARYAQPTSFEEKMAHAQELQKTRRIDKVTVAVDGMEEKAHRSFGRLPNMAYVVDKQGAIVFKSMWTRFEDIDAVLAELLAEDDAA